MDKEKSTDKKGTTDIRKSTDKVRNKRPYYSDPTANAAIGMVTRDEKRKRKKGQGKGQFRHPKIEVWRWEDEQRKADEQRKDDERRKADENEVKKNGG